MAKILLLRYDIECTQPARVSGFLDQLYEVHRRDRIPVSLFCSGSAIETRLDEFRQFARKIQGNPLFDVQDHSYSRIALGHDRTPPAATVADDYKTSFDVHEKVFGKRPIGVSLCDTGGRDGRRLPGFDHNDDTRAELAALAGLGVRMVNSFLTGLAESRAFCHYGDLGHPDVMGFPSGHSDRGWMVGKPWEQATRYIINELKQRAARREPMPVVLHDTVAWSKAPDRRLTHVRAIVRNARACGFELRTHSQCLEDESLWK